MIGSRTVPFLRGPVRLPLLCSAMGRSPDSQRTPRAVGRPESDSSASPERRLSGVVVPVVCAAALASGAAAWALAASEPSVTRLLGLLVAATFAEAFPVPIAGVSVGGVSLAASFIGGTAIIYGWAEATLLALLTRGLIELAQRRPPIRVAYNSAVYALSGAASGLAVEAVGGTDSVRRLLLTVAAGSVAFYVVNVVLIVSVVARTSDESFRAVLRPSVRWTVIPFGIMASVSLMLDVLWTRSPALSVALVGPLLAVALYQRSVHQALTAVRLAQTDPLTGLGNHRSFHEHLERGLERARSRRLPLTLCLLDVDNFKQVNDRWGHPIGDDVLARIASALRHGGEAFRLGGDEFALLLPGYDEQEGLAVCRAIVERIPLIEQSHGSAITVSAGIATYPGQAADRRQLVAIADAALYMSKRLGKNRIRAYQPELLELAWRRDTCNAAERQARLEAVASLASAVDARDACTGDHSRRVADLSARLAQRIGLDSDEVEFVRLAGKLHDIGKLAIPEEVLRKAGELTDEEIQMLRQHPTIGCRMLESLNIEPVAKWILYHHERWDGGGYPEGLSGDRIPLASRIIHVADAYDAMVSGRSYSASRNHVAVLEELSRCAGSQFDPGVVAVLIAELGDPLLVSLEHRDLHAQALGMSA